MSGTRNLCTGGVTIASLTNLVLLVFNVHEKKSVSGPEPSFGDTSMAPKRRKKAMDEMK